MQTDCPSTRKIVSSWISVEIYFIFAIVFKERNLSQTKAFYVFN